MTTRTGPIWLALAIVAGCRGSVTGVVTEAPVVGQWDLVGVDGAVGTANGMLQIGVNTPRGEYNMVVREPVADSFFSAGRYTWDGVVLVLTDSAGGPRMTGTLDATETEMDLKTRMHTFQLHKLPVFFLRLGGELSRAQRAVATESPRLGAA
jgi:hypothetical protein